MTLLSLVTIIWPVSEIILSVVRRARPGSAKVHDRGSAALLWSVIVVSVAAGISLQFVGYGRIPVSPTRLGLVALVVILVGLAIRWAAILTLGRLFNTTVAIHADHTIVRRGLYAKVRHPSYSGLLLAFVGLGLAFGNWPSLLVVVVPISAALGYRIRVEERALLEAFGDEYADYMSVSKRLVPWVY